MDLAEIRKKARQQIGQDGADAPVEPTFPAAALDEEGGEAQACTSPVAPNQTVAGLQQFFPDIDLASEEDYIQGLSGQDKNAEIGAVRWLSFCLGEEEYALSLDVVLELIRPRPYTELPKVPDYVRGILSLRGEVVPVIDLRKRLQLGRGADESSQRIIVCEGKEQSIGLLVDKVIQVARMPEASIEPAPLTLSGGERGFVAGVGRCQGRMLILLSPAEILEIESEIPQAARLLDQP